MLVGCKVRGILESHWISCQTCDFSLSLSAASRFYQNLHSALLTEKLQRVQIQDPHDAPETEKGTDEEEEKEEREKKLVYINGGERGSSMRQTVAMVMGTVVCQG